MRQIVFLVLLISNCSYAGETSNWQTARETEQLKLQYRWIDSIDTREVRILFSVRANHNQIINCIRDPQLAKQWAVGVKDYRVYDMSPDRWIAYSLYKIPKPFAAQDLITRYKIVNESSEVKITITALPDYLERISGVNRQQNYSGKWILKETQNGITQIQFYSISYTKPLVPRFMQDPITQRVLIRSFEEFIKLSENEKAEK